MFSENPPDSLHKTRSAVITPVPEQVNPLDQREAPAAADLAVRDVALIEPDRDKP